MVRASPDINAAELVARDLKRCMWELKKIFKEGYFEEIKTMAGQISKNIVKWSVKKLIKFTECQGSQHV